MSDVAPAVTAANSLPGSPVPQPTALQTTGGNFLPPSGKGDPSSAVTIPSTSAPDNVRKNNADAVTSKPAASDTASLQARVQYLNKYLNDSGRPNQFRVEPQSRGQTIQEINPANGEVIGEFAAAEFPALARSLGVSGALVDSQA
jgi:hypothetical protein